MNLESTPSTALSPEAIAQLVKGHRDFLAFVERRVESRAVAEDILHTAFAARTGARRRRAGGKGRRVVLSGAAQRRDRSLPAAVKRRASDGSLDEGISGCAGTGGGTAPRDLPMRIEPARHTQAGISGSPAGRRFRRRHTERPGATIRHHRRQCGRPRASSQGGAASPDRTVLRHLRRSWMPGLFVRNGRREAVRDVKGKPVAFLLGHSCISRDQPRMLESL